MGEAGAVQVGRSRDKLGGPYHDAICRQAAMGRGVREICRKVANGLETGEGSILVGVNVVESSIWARLARDPERVASWRLKLYGTVDNRLSIQPGWRLDKLESLLHQALVARNHAKGAQARSWSSEVRQILGEIRKELDFQGLAVSQAVAHQHLHLHGERPQVIGRLARDLAGVLAAGGGEKVAKLLASAVASSPRRTAQTLEGQATDPDPPNASSAAQPPYGGSGTALSSEVLPESSLTELEGEVVEEEAEVDLEGIGECSIF